jgi:hypothetical protein
MPKFLTFLCCSLFSNSFAEVTRSVSVASALQSDLSLRIGSIAGGIERTLRLPHLQLGSIQKLAKKCLLHYATDVTVLEKSATCIEAAPLPLEKQVELERYFDDELLKICPKVEAERVKYLFIRFLYFQTGAFGKHALRMEVLDGALFVSAGPLKPVKVVLAEGEFLFTHPLLTNMLLAQHVQK